MKKLLIISDNYAPRLDGIARFLLEIIPRLKDYFNITVLCPDFGNTTNEIKHIKIPLFKFLIADFKVAKLKLKTIKNAVKDSDVVFVQTISVLGFYGIKYAKKFKKPIVIYKHSIEWELVPDAVNKPFLSRFLYSFVRAFTKKLYNKCDIILTPSQSIAEKLSWHKLKSKKIVVPLGVDSKLFIASKNKSNSKESIGLNPKDLIIGYHGRLAYEKGIKTLIRVYRHLARKYKNIHLVLLGDGIDELKLFAKKRNVTVISGRKNVVPYLQAMDIYCMPSLTETTCLSLIEAMSCELPVITTKTGLIPDYIINKENGIFINKKNTHSLSKAIKMLIDDTKFRQKIGKNARKTVKDYFEWDNTAKKIIDILNKIT